MPLLFAATLFVSAFLLFLVQPMIHQMILPRLGGTPAVWNTCMVFFQAALLAGYGYTHSATTYMPTKRQTLVQCGLLLLPFVFLVLPLSIGDWTPATEANPIWSTLYILLIVVGLPFFVVATSAPLLQRWFASTGHPSSKDPYFLYGASNFGSMLALLGYPFIFQRIFDLPAISMFWMIVYGLLIFLVAICALIVWRAPQIAMLASPSPAAPPPALAVAKVQQHVTRRPGRSRVKAPVVAPMPTPVVKSLDEKLTWLRRLRWIGLAAAPTSLMLGVTTYITTDIAAIPLLVILPLAFYLLSFILVFARWPVVWTGLPHRLFVYLQGPVLLAMGLLILAYQVFGAWGVSTWWMIVAYVGTFFVCTMVCHGELAKDRPPVRHLTEFYLWMAVGGVLGGMFNAMIAPVIFKHIIEFFLVLVLVLFLRPQTHFLEWIRGKKEPDDDHTLQEYLLDLGYAVCLGLLGYALLRLAKSEGFWGKVENTTRPVFERPFTKWCWSRFVDAGYDGRRAEPWAYWTELFVVTGIPAAICLCFAGRPVRLGLSVIGLAVATYFWLPPDTDTIYANRSFFGVQRVRRDVNSFGTYNVLIHGGIDHGRQNLEPTQRSQVPFFDPSNPRDQPISYFWPTNPIGQIFMQLRQMESKPPFAVVGLGTGTMASYANKGQSMDFYEIDAAVWHLSEPPDDSETYFWYLKDARKRGVNLQVILGDGRLKIQDAPPNYYQIIMLDAFSSDAIPVHLLTKEAIELYLTKLKDDGILIFNITNRYVAIAPELKRVANALDLVCLKQYDEYDPKVPEKFASDWVILFRKPKYAPRMAAQVASAVASLQPATMAFNPGLGMVAISELDRSIPLLARVDLDKWEEVKLENDRLQAWTDRYQDLIRAMNW